MSRLDQTLRDLGLDQIPRLPIFAADRAAGFHLGVPGDRAIELWYGFREAFDTTGYWPVILGEEDDLDYLEEARECNSASLEEILRLAAGLDGQVWLASRRAEAIEQLRQAGVDVSTLDTEPPRGDWPDDVEPHHLFSGANDLATGEFLPSVHLGLIPVRDPEEVPAFLRFGGWNECPGPVEHVAVHRSWSERFGAEVVRLSHDTIEMRVWRPPLGRESALALAAEQYSYCADIVDQGTGTIDALAATLLGGTAWFFWWD